MGDKASIFKGRKARLEVLALVRPADQLPEPQEAKPDERLQAGGGASGVGDTDAGGGGATESVERVAELPEPVSEVQSPALSSDEVPNDKPKRRSRSSARIEEPAEPVRPSESDFSHPIRPKRRF